MRRRWLRGVRGVLVAVVWGAMMVLLAQRERAAQRPREAPPVEWPARATTDRSKEGAGGSEEWLGVYLNGSKLGFAHNRRRPHGGGLQLDTRSRLRLPLQGRVCNVETASSVILDAASRLRSFRFVMRSEVQTMEVRGTVAANRLRLVVDTGGTRTERVVALQRPIALPDAVVSVLRHSGRLRPNTRYTFEVFDPVALAPASATVIVGESESIPGSHGPVRALRTEMAYRGFRTVAWVTPQGETLREESALGWTLVRQSREAALEPPAASPGADLIYSAAIRSNVPVRHPRQVRFLRAEMTGADLSALSLASERQKVERPDSGIVEVRAEDVSASEAPRLPVTSPQMKPYLAADTLIQSDHPEIRAAARAVVGGERNAWEAAKRIGRWVHRALEKSPTVSVPSAVDVLRTRRGDCNEHTVLFVALARAAGIPAEPIAGIVYLDENQSFYYHAWPRVWVGRWVSMDPTFGQDVADAAHIELVRGGLDRQSEILGLVGRLRVRIIRAEE